MDKAKSTSQAVYSDPEIKQMERQIKVLRARQQVVTDTDRVVSSSIIHQNDGTTAVLVVTKDGHVWKAEINSDDQKWVSALPAIPNTPAFDDDYEITNIQRLIDKRRAARGQPTDEDIDEELDEILNS